MPLFLEARERANCLLYKGRPVAEVRKALGREFGVEAGRGEIEGLAARLERARSRKTSKGLRGNMFIFSAMEAAPFHDSLYSLAASLATRPQYAATVQDVVARLITHRRSREISEQLGSPRRTRVLEALVRAPRHVSLKSLARELADLKGEKSGADTIHQFLLRHVRRDEIVARLGKREDPWKDLAKHALENAPRYPSLMALAKGLTRHPAYRGVTQRKHTVFWQLKALPEIAEIQAGLSRPPVDRKSLVKDALLIAPAHESLRSVARELSKRAEYRGRKFSRIYDILQKAGERQEIERRLKQV
jgi:hypothetical protein